METIVDWIGLDEFPWWKNTFSKVFTCVPIENAANLTTFIYENVKNAYTKPVLLTEFGWPGTSGEDRKSAPNKYTGEECGIANPANQIRANQEVLDYCATHNLPCTVFEAFNELWKGSNAHDINVSCCYVD
jgi:exo-beta-1,3-glucanase (GH17 family)